MAGQLEAALADGAGGIEGSTGAILDVPFEYKGSHCVDGVRLDSLVVERVWCCAGGRKQWQ